MTQLKKNPSENMHQFLDKYCINLNNQVNQKKIDPIIGRSKEIDRTIHILSKEEIKTTQFSLVIQALKKRH